MRVGPVLVALVMAAALAGGAAAIWFGVPDVAATTPHWALTRWILSTTMERSVARRARALEPPAFLDESPRIRAGAREYDEMCAGCHGAPGVEPGHIGKGLNPEPPDLARAAPDWTVQELFWITAHGVRMTGMPGFAASHSDEELWEIVAFVKRLPRMSDAEYRALLPADADSAERTRIPTSIPTEEWRMLAPGRA